MQSRQNELIAAKNAAEEATRAKSLFLGEWACPLMEALQCCFLTGLNLSWLFAFLARCLSLHPCSSLGRFLDPRCKRPSLSVRHGGRVCVQLPCRMRSVLP